MQSAVTIFPFFIIEPPPDEQERKKEEKHLNKGTLSQKVVGNK